MSDANTGHFDQSYTSKVVEYMGATPFYTVYINDINMNGTWQTVGQAYSRAIDRDQAPYVRLLPSGMKTCGSKR